MTDEQIDQIYEIFAKNYLNRFKIRMGSDCIKKGTLRLCRKKDFHYELKCSKEYLDEEMFVVTLLYPFDFDYNENSLLFDYRLSTLTGERKDLISIVDMLSSSEDKKTHRFLNEIIEIEFISDEE